MYQFRIVNLAQNQIRIDSIYDWQSPQALKIKVTFNSWIVHKAPDR
ncbi:MAG: hypothetical protein LBQ98_00725 [Nitrososphaerota archaeon]|nr:hypothetical protein [Nitrososphaerota archaeon]